jgi:hypothetical protein
MELAKEHLPSATPTPKGTLSLRLSHRSFQYDAQAKYVINMRRFKEGA